MLVYDGTSTAGIQMADIDLATGNLEFDAAFNDGLYIETTNLSNVLVVYE